MAQSSLAFTGLLLTGVAMLAAVAPALAESPAPEIVSPLVATPIAPPNPVLGADARRHKRDHPTISAPIEVDHSLLR